MPKANHTDAPATNHPGLWSRLSTLQRLAAIASVVVMVSAIGLQVVASPTTPDRPAPTSSPTRAPTPEGLVQGFGAAETPPARTTEDTDTTEDHPLDQWSPAIFRMGFSFCVGFAIAFALRTFVRLSLIAIGVFFLALFGLQYAGFIEVN